MLDLHETEDEVVEEPWTATRGELAGEEGFEPSVS
jgi:hypothetical protein